MIIIINLYLNFSPLVVFPLCAFRSMGHVNAASWGPKNLKKDSDTSSCEESGAPYVEGQQSEIFVF